MTPYQQLKLLQDDEQDEAVTTFSFETIEEYDAWMASRPR